MFVATNKHVKGIEKNVSLQLKVFQESAFAASVFKRNWKP